MSISSRSLHLGACYITTEKELRKIVEFDGNSLCYVVRGRMAYPSWDKQHWHSMTLQAFAAAVLREVSCDSRPL
jgi:hypothetical protein